ncbi:hypothetical protein PH586_13195 [Pseudomonas sp. SA3-5]|uniref:Plasmid replication protein RepB n=1 Tax=Pseudomonas aestuarii TaxID=3018340 RepID=A0ABT4XGJ4_9PSED|nr:hypothetical protein [Pseudomonas aestuarii]MDA7087341.1 hypothetical protein [Pseudomonas aestuarii]
MTENNLSEGEMRRALGLDPAPPKQAQSQSKPAACYTLVELSVRKDGGPPLRFEHRSRSISTLAAQLEAEKAARAKGYEVWVLLDIRQISE